MIFGENTPQNYNREHNSLVGMYASFAILILIVFGITGTKSNFDGIKRYHIKNTELKEIEKKVEEKKSYLTLTEKAISTMSAQEKSINSMIPQGENFEKYVEEIVAANSGFGYEVEKVSFTKQTQSGGEEAADVSIVFSTKDENSDLEGLIKSLEKTPRLSIIERLAYVKVADKKTLRVDLKIYLIK